MSLITRPTKPVGGGGGTSWVAGADLYANELNDDIDTLYNDYNGNITDGNCAAGMALQGSKLANAPNGIPAGKYNAQSIATADIADDAVTADKLRDSAVNDALRAVTTDHIKDANVSFAKLKSTTYSNPAQLVINANATNAIDTAVPIARFPISYYVVRTAAQAAVMISLYQETGTWWIRFLNLVAAPVTLPIDTIKFIYME